MFGQEGSSFELCGEGKMHPYYYPELKYEGDFHAIKQHFEMAYDSKPFRNLDNTSGVLTVQFQVNCKGQTGNFIVKMVDFDFKSIEMNEQLVHEILVLTKKLNRWIPANNEEGELVNSHKFISFKLVDGIILDIFPK